MSCIHPFLIDSKGLLTTYHQQLLRFDAKLATELSLCMSIPFRPVWLTSYLFKEKKCCWTFKVLPSVLLDIWMRVALSLQYRETDELYLVFHLIITALHHKKIVLRLLFPSFLWYWLSVHGECDIKNSVSFIMITPCLIELWVINLL